MARPALWNGFSRRGPGPERVTLVLLAIARLGQLFLRGEYLEILTAFLGPHYPPQFGAAIQQAKARLRELTRASVLGSSRMIRGRGAATPDLFHKDVCGEELLVAPIGYGAPTCVRDGRQIVDVATRTMEFWHNKTAPFVYTSRSRRDAERRRGTRSFIHARVFRSALPWLLSPLTEAVHNDAQTATTQGLLD